MNRINKIFITAATALLIMPIANCQVTHPQPDFSRVFNPAIPETVTFAGTVVDLDREDMFERYDRELTSMAYTHGNTLLTLKRANKYFPVILPLLKEANVPEDLIYVACIESNMNPFAVSPAKAAGLWQFMPATGKDYGLEVNEFVDERYDIEKSTKAACRFLKQAYQRFGKWESVAASYNGGMGRITRELDAQKQKSAYDLYLTDETNRYMFRLLAMKEIMENPSKYGFEIDESQLYYPAEYDIVKVNTPVEDWAVWAVNHDTNYMTLREHNPWIRAKSLPNKTGKTYEVKIPKKNSVSRKKQNRKISVKGIQAED